MTQERGPQRDVFVEMWGQGWEAKPNGEAGREALSRLEDRATNGEAWASTIVQRHAARSLTADWKVFRKSMAPTIAVSHEGEVIGVYGEVAMPIRDANGQRVGGEQMLLIKFMTWDALREAYQRERARIKRLTANAFALRELLAYHSRCPEAATPFEACVALGLDPDNLVIEVA